VEFIRDFYKKSRDQTVVMNVSLSYAIKFSFQLDCRLDLRDCVLTSFSIVLGS
jgi:hypothetical protein